MISMEKQKIFVGRADSGKKKWILLVGKSCLISDILTENLWTQSEGTHPDTCPSKSQLQAFKPLESRTAAVHGFQDVFTSFPEQAGGGDTWDSDTWDSWRRPSPIYLSQNGQRQRTPCDLRGSEAHLPERNDIAGEMERSFPQISSSQGRARPIHLGDHKKCPSQELHTCKKIF